LALSFVAAPLARVDFAVIRFFDGHYEDLVGRGRDTVGRSLVQNCDHPRLLVGADCPRLAISNGACVL